MEHVHHIASGIVSFHHRRIPNCIEVTYKFFNFKSEIILIIFFLLSIENQLNWMVQSEAWEGVDMCLFFFCITESETVITPDMWTKNKNKRFANSSNSNSNGFIILCDFVLCNFVLCVNHMCCYDCVIILCALDLCNRLKINDVTHGCWNHARMYHTWNHSSSRDDQWMWIKM